MELSRKAGKALFKRWQRPKFLRAFWIQSEVHFEFAAWPGAVLEISKRFPLRFRSTSGRRQAWVR